MRSRWNCSVADWTRCSVYPPFHCLGTFRATGSPIEIERGHCEQSGVHKKRFIKTRRGVEEEGSQHIHIFINFQRSTSFLVHCCTLSLCYLDAETHVSLHWHWLITVMNWLIDNDHYRNPNVNNRDHLVGQLTTSFPYHYLGMPSMGHLAGSHCDDDDDDDDDERENCIVSKWNYEHIVVPGKQICLGLPTQKIRLSRTYLVSY